MNIKVLNDFTNHAPLVLIPVIQTDQIADQLKQFAFDYQLDTLILENEFKADTKQTVTLFNAKAQKIVFLGLGKTVVSLDFIKIFRTYISQNKAKLTDFVQIDLRNFEPQIAEYVQNGIMLGGYNLALYKTNEKSKNELFKKSSTIEILTNADSKITANFVKRGKTIGKTQLGIFDLMKDRKSVV